MFSQRHYIEVAKIVARIENHACRVNVWADFEALFERDSPRFDGSKFAVACRVMNPPKQWGKA
jgi:hypothetical protein